MSRERWSVHLWGAMIVSTTIHVLVFALWPPMATTPWGGPGRGTPTSSRATEIVRLRTAAAEVRAPAVAPTPRPETSRPDVPDPDPVHLSRFAWLPPSVAPTAPTILPSAPAMGFAAPFVPASLLNAEDVAHRLRPAYERLLAATRVEGRAVFHLGLDGGGRVRGGRIVSSSGDPRLDRVAAGALEHMRFSPETLRGEPRPTLVKISVTFQVRATGGR